jgi:hypothetical protein
MTVACAFSAGNGFDARYVERLQAGLARALARPFAFRVLGPPEVEWPGWWAKIAAFAIPGPVLLVDLDTVFVGSLVPLADAVERSAGEVFMLRDFNTGAAASGLVAWNGDRSDVFRAFEAGARAATWTRGRYGVGAVLASGAFRGDGEWLRAWLLGRGLLARAAVQDLADGVVSYKNDVYPLGGRLPAGARVVCFHGRPRPHEVRGAAWLAEAWGDGW